MDVSVRIINVVCLIIMSISFGCNFWTVFVRKPKKWIKPTILMIIDIIIVFSCSYYLVAGESIWKVLF